MNDVTTVMSPLLSVEDGFGPEDVALLDQVLVQVYERASERIHLGDGLRNMLAAAVIEGAQQDIRQPDALTRFALRAIPAFREISVD